MRSPMLDPARPKVLDPEGPARQAEWIGSASWAVCTETHAAVLPVFDAMGSLLVATRHDWRPAGTSEPGGWTISSLTGRYAVRAGAYLLTDPAAAAAVTAADAFELWFALSRALRGEPPLREALPSPLLLGGDGAQNAAVIQAASTEWGRFRPAMVALARLAWRGAFTIVAPQRVLTGYAPIRMEPA